MGGLVVLRSYNHSNALNCTQTHFKMYSIHPFWLTTSFFTHTGLDSKVCLVAVVEFLIVCFCVIIGNSKQKIMYCTLQWDYFVDNTENSTFKATCTGTSSFFIKWSLLFFPPLCQVSFTFTLVCLFVGLSAGSHKNCRMDLSETWMEAGSQIRMHPIYFWCGSG